MRGEGSGGVVRCGHLKKLKTSRRKFFVLRAETSESSARLEYYDSERKYAGGLPPKRSIPLKNCFNINRRLDTKHKHVIALYTKDDCFCVVLDTDEDVDGWLKALLSLQHGEEAVDGEAPRPTFEHVWQVTVLNRGLGTAGLTGDYRLCLTDRTLSLIRRDCEVPQIELNLANIRSCGALKDFFFLEIGRSSTLGAGELWMKTEDPNIAQNVHSTVFHAMSNNSNREELVPRTRNRSSSATESSKPTTMARKIHSNAPPKCHIVPQGLSGGGGRERCDSMPSRARTTSEGNHTIQVWNQARSHLNPYRTPSLHGRDISHSPPSGSPVSPPSVGCSTDSGSSYSLPDDADVCTELDPMLARYGHSLTPDEAIAEEDCPDSPQSMPYGGNYLPMHSSDDGYVDMSPRGRHHNNSPTPSLSSVTSGTPSTDMRFAEYPLEKVSSYFTPTEDDDTRPARAYSVGSRPENCRKYSEMFITNSDNLRVRALSVGSKTKKAPARVLPPHGYHPHQSTKSSSAPLLSNSRGQGSYNSIGPMDDLMEMDFSRSGSVNNSGYVDMKPGPRNNHGYVEMKPGVNNRKADNSPYVDMSSGSSPAKHSYISPQSEHGINDLPRDTSSDYLEMDPRKNSNANINNNNNNTDYLEMSFRSRTDQSNYQLSPTKVSQLHGSPPGGFIDSHLDSPQTEPPTPEGYVEMSLGRGHQRQSSLDSAQIVNGDYANMSAGKKRDRNSRKKEKSKSQPIAIKNPSGGAQKNNGTSSNSPMYSMVGRKYSTGTPPTMHLPLTADSSPYASLPRTRHRKNSRRDSKDSSSSSVTTPSGSSTIFPISLNSPCSPVKPAEAASATIKVPPAVLQAVYNKPTKNKTDNSDYTPMDFENAKKGGGHSDYVNYDPGNPEDYALMKPGVRVTSPVSARMVMMQLSDSTFRPINENKEEGGAERGDAPLDPPYEMLRTCPAPLSRPASTTSELCSSSGSTIVGSRPESVNSDRVRPASVSSADGQLHYASLDLEEGNRSPKTGKGQEGQAEMPLTYAAIDFVRSEGLKHNSLATNAKVKH